jgi:hypothetical protein
MKAQRVNLSSSSSRKGWMTEYAGEGLICRAHPDVIRRLATAMATAKAASEWLARRSPSTTET